MIREHKAFLTLSAEDYAALVERAALSWRQIQEIASGVPEPSEMRAVLATTGGPVTVQDLGLTDEEGQLGVRFGHYLRNRFTIAKLAWLLGLLDEPVVAQPLERLMRQMPAYLGLDVSTTAAKALLLDDRGRTVVSGAHTYPLRSPRPLWAEQDPEDWWRAGAAAIRDVLTQSGLQGKMSPRSV